MKDLTQEKVMIFLKEQWKPVMLGTLIVLGLVITILIPSKNSSQGNPTKNVTNKNGANTTGNNSVTDKKPFNLFGFLIDKKEKTDGSTQRSASAALINIPTGNPAVTIPSTIIKKSASGTSTTQTLNQNGTTQTAQGIIDTQVNIQTGVNSNTQPDNIAIVFQNPDGSTFTYIPPGTPPDDVRWGRYKNTKSNYEINYPSNWQFVYSIDSDGFEGIALYPPGADINNRNSPLIGFGMSASFLLPTVGDTGGALKTPLIVDGKNGSLYTNGSFGDSYIASILSYSGNYFGLGSSKTDATFAYVYYYMINSLTFGGE